MPKAGAGFWFEVAVFRKFKAFSRSWFYKSTVLVGQAVPNNANAADCPSPFLSRSGSLLRSLKSGKICWQSWHFIGGVLYVVSRFFASVTRAAADWRRWAGWLLRGSLAYIGSKW